MASVEYCVPLRTKQKSVFESNVVETAFGIEDLEDYITTVNTSGGTSSCFIKTSYEKPRPWYFAAGFDK